MQKTLTFLDFILSLSSSVRWVEQVALCSWQRSEMKPRERSDLPRKQSIQLTLVPSLAAPLPPFRPHSLCVLAQATQGLPGKGGAGVSQEHAPAASGWR